MTYFNDRNETLKDFARTAINNILSNTDSMLDGNGVHSEGQMYPDVEAGLKIALYLLKDESYDWISNTNIGDENE